MAKKDASRIVGGGGVARRTRSSADLRTRLFPVLAVGEKRQAAEPSPFSDSEDELHSFVLFDVTKEYVQVIYVDAAGRILIYLLEEHDPQLKLTDSGYMTRHLQEIDMFVALAARPRLLLSLHTAAPDAVLQRRRWTRVPEDEIGRKAPLQTTRIVRLTDHGSQEGDF